MSIYQPLSVERSEIRILTLLPGRERDALKCALRVRSLDDGPKFEALSYLWGTDRPSHPVLLSGREVTVRDSLDGALRGLRRRFRPRQIWADALCINQDDPREKNTQVPLMARIYRESSRTLAWLGPLDPAMDLFISLLQPWYSAPRLWCTAYLGLLPLAAAVSDRARTIWAETLYLYLLSEKQYNSADYWDRMWTLPEFLLPRKVRMMYGSRTFAVHQLDPDDHAMIHSFDLALRGIDHDGINRNEVEARFFHCSLWSVTLRRSFMHGRRPNPKMVFLGSTHRQCLRRHDYVYALYSLLPELQVLHPVDYGKSVPQLMLETTAYLISRGVCGEMYLFHPLYKASSPSDFVPSWVVDFSQRLNAIWVVNLHPEFLPSVPAPPNDASPDNTALPVAARKIGYCTSVLTLSREVPQMVKQLKYLLTTLSDTESDSQDDRIVFRLVRMLMRRWELADDTKVDNCIRTWVTTPTQTLTARVQGGDEELLSDVGSVFAGANIIVISDRWLGIATGCVAEGDMVILHHMKWGPPFVVRPGSPKTRDGQVDYYTLVGVVRIEGITDCTSLDRAAVEEIGRTDVEEILLR